MKFRRLFTLVAASALLSLWIAAYNIHTLPFTPSNTVTLAEGLATACRLHASLNGQTVALASGTDEWLDPFLAYAAENDLADGVSMDDPVRAVTAGEYAMLAANACGVLPAINAVDMIPGVAAGAPYADAVLSLFRAGILTGYDENGQFAPESPLTREEWYLINERIVFADRRVSKTYPPLGRTFTDAYAVVDAERSGTSRTGIANGWQYDNRFEYGNTDGTRSATLNDTGSVIHTALVRRFTPEDEGLFQMKVVARLASGNDGVYEALETADEEKIVYITPRGGYWKLIGKNGATVSTDIAVSDKSAVLYHTEFLLDLDKHTASVKINGNLFGPVEIEATPIDRFVIGTSKNGVGSFTLCAAEAYKNYIINETFYQSTDTVGMAPAGWESEGFTVAYAKSSYGYDLDSAVAVGSASAVKRFEPVTGKFCFQTYVLLPEKADGASVSLQSGGRDVLKFETKDGCFVMGETVLHDYLPNVWYLLSFDADIPGGTAEVKINGKKKAVIPFTAYNFDAVHIAFDPEDDTKELWFDDVILYPLTEHDDYPAPPVSAQTDNYHIGVNVCYLWRDNDALEGWDSVANFPEFDTPLGFYDEGSREYADWEIKFLAEHGVDFMHICWYEPYDNVDAPLKKMARSYHALHEGYMNAKYSDTVDFCIMWENGGAGVADLQHFKDYIWPFWKEYYFSDDRYARLDNKAILTVWSTDTLLADFGNEAGVKAWRDYLESELKKMGYDGLILLATHSAGGGTSKARYEQLAAMGFDATYTYNSGKTGYTAAYQINGMNALYRNCAGVGHAIPSVSIGFNNIGRWDERLPVITPEEHLQVCEYIKTKLASFGSGTWKDKTLFVSSLNEFSEGTYVFPTSLYGWSYLENVRQTFGDAFADASAIHSAPSQTQKARVNHLYPPHFALIRRMKYESESAHPVGDSETAVFSETPQVIDSYDFSSGDYSAFKANHGLTCVGANGVLAGTVNHTDAAVISTSAFRSYSADTAPIVHIRMKSSVSGANLRLFFITDNDNVWNNAKRVVVKTNGGDEFYDYYVDMSGNVLYTSTVTGFRFDPMSGYTGTYEVSLIEFLGYTKYPSVNVNGLPLDLSFTPRVTSDGDYVVGMEMRKGFFSMMRLYYDWDRIDGVLLLKSYNDHTLVLTMGQETAILDGSTVSLGFKPYLRDGLPMVNLNKLCDLLCYSYFMDGSVLMIRACSDDQYDAIVRMNTDHSVFEFDVDGESEGWTFQNAYGTVSGGYLRLTPTNTDPAVIRQFEYDASDYDTLVVGVKYNSTMRASGVEAPLCFFATLEEPSFTATKKVAGTYDFNGAASDGTVEVRFDLPSNALYTGTVTKLRFDPYNRATPFDIQFIRLENSSAD